jgi:SAM-dependent methyltransferase
MKKNAVQEEVSKEYARMLKDNETRKGSGASQSGPGVIAGLAGYEPESHQQAAASQSFGCGNPLAFADIEPGQTVLDLGSGAGLDLMLAADRVGSAGRVIGIDMTQEMVDKARENVTKAGYTNIDVRLGVIEDLPLPDSSVDWVISNCVINLSTDKARVFNEVARVLKPGGRFSISDIVVEELPEFLRENAALYSACIAGAISEEAYLAGLRYAGLEDIAVSERLVYEASQLVSLISCELPGLDLSKEMIDEIAPMVAGKVWSAKFIGRMPRAAG